jgi:hypothetical protein
MSATPWSHCTGKRDGESSTATAFSSIAISSGSGVKRMAAIRRVWGRGRRGVLGNCGSGSRARGRRRPASSPSEGNARRRIAGRSAMSSVSPCSGKATAAGDIRRTVMTGSTASRCSHLRRPTINLNRRPRRAPHLEGMAYAYARRHPPLQRLRSNTRSITQDPEHPRKLKETRQRKTPG